MKRLLFYLLLFAFSSTLFVNGQTTKKFYPTASMAGMTEKSGTYKTQSISSEPKTIIIGKDNETYGRGYLEFDLSSIPADATINSAGLQLTSMPTIDTNFDGKINVNQGIDGITEANASTWYMIRGGVGNPLITFKFEYAGDGYFLTPASLLALVKERVQNKKKMYIQINHYDENKIVRLNGDAKDLYLEVNYTSQSSGGGNGGGTDPIPGEYKIEGPTTIYPGETVTYKFNAVGNRGNELKWWIIGGGVDQSKDVEYKKDSYGFNTEIKFRAKETAESVCNIHLKAQFMEYRQIDEYTRVGTAIKVGELTIKKLADIKIVTPIAVCSNETFTASINKIYPDHKEYEWSCDSSITLISGNNLSSATFKLNGSKSGKIYLKLTTTRGDKLSFNKEIWTGAPLLRDTSSETIYTYCWNDLPPRLDVVMSGAESYKWTSPTQNTTFSNSGNSLYLSSYNLPGYNTYNMPRSITVYVVGSNKCGSSARKEFHLIFQDWNDYKKWCENKQNSKPGGGGAGTIRPEKSMPIEETTKPSEPVSIKVYNLSGILVYQEKEIVNFNIGNTVLRKGVYIIETTDKEGKVTREKVAKN